MKYRNQMISGYKGITIIALLMAVGFSSCSGADTSEPDNTTEATIGSTEGIETDVSIEESTEPSTENMEAYKSECQEFDYKEYFRNEQQHIGEKLKLEMWVDQVIDGDFRGYDDQGNEYYIFDEREDAAPFRVMEDDILIVYGEYYGVEKLTRAIGDYESEVFCITAKYADLIGEDGIVTETDAVALTEPTVQESSSNYYSDSILLWKSYYEPLTGEDFAGLSKDELKIARNEIYAAYGRIFSSQDLMNYFNSKSWYSGTVPADQFNDSVLTDVQKKNIEMIQLYEDLAGQEDFSTNSAYGEWESYKGRNDQWYADYNVVSPVELKELGKDATYSTYGYVWDIIWLSGESKYIYRICVNYNNDADIATGRNGEAQFVDVMTDGYTEHSDEEIIDYGSKVMVVGIYTGMDTEFMETQSVPLVTADKFVLETSDMTVEELNYSNWSLANVEGDVEY